MASKYEGNSIAQCICHRPDAPHSHGRNARARTSPFSSTGNTRRRLPCRRNADPYTALLRRFMKSRKACLHRWSSIFTEPPRSGCQACFKVRVTSQNSPQLLVSKKCDLADSKGSDLTSIELLKLFSPIA